MTTDVSTVLIVDDNEDLASAYATGLSDEYAVRTAHDGQEALNKIDESVDVALLDRRMPDMDGEEVLREMRERQPDVRIAMVTAVDPDFDAAEMPLDDYLVKPVGFDELNETVEELLSLSNYDDQMRELFRLSQKKALLEQKKSDSVLANSDEYTALKEEYAELNEAMRTCMDAQGDDFFNESLESEGR